MAERPLPLAEEIDLPRFMGKWYVIASIPTPFERDAYNAVEFYEYVGDSHGVIVIKSKGQVQFGIQRQ